MRESLTKENFWNELYAKYPKGTQVFCDWIDKYKKSVNWTDLFRDHLNGDAKFSSPKYHDLPYAMQMGIWFQFEQEFDLGRIGSPNFSGFDLRNRIEQYISVMQFNIDNP